ncbi:preprotein translocase subunit YajC [Pelagerythrobacter marinus]|uniref:hypothetical protein n=1 Tax=Pelagerythrobacter marinus TaxID=538382 RepID=UPI002AC9131A|nr:hypothetical protein [Pelagerythrobacter marinus]WPZ05651.1 hypothetical protein T8T98_09435 [Pelagerythrobacter marinus]
MTKQVRINVRHAINNAAIRRERRDGRDYIVVPSATMPDGIVMNRVRYPADEIAKAFGSLENTPAPLGHPTIEGAFVSAKDPEGLARGWIGAWNKNVRRENGRVWLDKVIDVATANQLDGGKAVLEAIEEGDPIHSSTGLYAILTAVQNDDEADWEASDIVFDHDAILLGEEGAATPEQGVGLLVNAAAAPDGEKIDVINCSLEDDIDRDMGWSIESMLRAVERKERLGLIEQAKNYITRLIQGDPTPEINKGDALTTNEDAMDKAQFDALSGEVKALSDTVAAIPETIATAVANAVKPLTDALEAQAKDAADKAEADRLELANKVIEAGLLEETVAKEATASVLNALLEKHKTPAAAYRVNRAFKQDGGKPTYTAPEGD